MNSGGFRRTCSSSVSTLCVCVTVPHMLYIFIHKLTLHIAVLSPLRLSVAGISQIRNLLLLYYYNSQCLLNINRRLPSCFVPSESPDCSFCVNLLAMEMLSCDSVVLIFMSMYLCRSLYVKLNNLLTNEFHFFNTPYYIIYF